MKSACLRDEAEQQIPPRQPFSSRYDDANSGADYATAPFAALFEHAARATPPRCHFSAARSAASSDGARHETSPAAPAPAPPPFTPPRA